MISPLFQTWSILLSESSNTYPQIRQVNLMTPSEIQVGGIGSLYSKSCSTHTATLLSEGAVLEGTVGLVVGFSVGFSEANSVSEAAVEVGAAVGDAGVVEGSADSSGSKEPVSSETDSIVSSSVSIEAASMFEGSTVSSGTSDSPVCDWTIASTSLDGASSVEESAIRLSVTDGGIVTSDDFC